MRHLSVIGGHRDEFGATTRNDALWVGPVVTAAGLTRFFGYLTFRAFQATHVWYDPYLSPTVSPLLFTPVSGYPGPCRSSMPGSARGRRGGRRSCRSRPRFFFPAFAIAFRFTCYYYRKAYYRAFAMSPPACAVRGVHRTTEARPRS